MLVSEVFGRVLSMCPTLQAVAGEALSREAHDALRPMPAAYDILSAPLVEDRKAPNSNVEHLRHLAEDIGSGANLLTASSQRESRFSLIIDKQLKKRALASKDTVHIVSSGPASNGTSTNG